MKRAYPRWRGGNRGGSPWVSPLWGLSPLARGKLVEDLLVDRIEGPIPAGAGETVGETPSRSAARAYPRWRGGNRLLLVEGCREEGLSPLARGKHEEGEGGLQELRPIPAGAGETAGRSAGRLRDRAYPRWRGGNGLCGQVWQMRRGLSPLARGKRLRSPLAAAAAGPIPAGAGETNPRSTERTAGGAYPRWRGGNELMTRVKGCDEGLSPLARGKRLRH